jgi:hypothetical protein
LVATAAVVGVIILIYVLSFAAIMAILVPLVDPGGGYGYGGYGHGNSTWP